MATGLKPLKNVSEETLEHISVVAPVVMHRNPQLAICADEGHSCDPKMRLRLITGDEASSVWRNLSALVENAVVWWIKCPTGFDDDLLEASKCVLDVKALLRTLQYDAHVNLFAAVGRLNCEALRVLCRILNWRVSICAMRAKGYGPQFRPCNRLGKGGASSRLTF